MKTEYSLEAAFARVTIVDRVAGSQDPFAAHIGRSVDEARSGYKGTMVRPETITRV
jgi:hypothetical protein